MLRASRATRRAPYTRAVGECTVRTTHATQAHLHAEQLAQVPHIVEVVEHARRRRRRRGGRRRSERAAQRWAGQGGRAAQSQSGGRAQHHAERREPGRAIQRTPEVACRMSAFFF